MEQQIQLNYQRVKLEVKQIIADEILRIDNDPDLEYLWSEDKKANKQAK